MRIAYVLDDNISIKTGVVNKIISKIREWESSGHSVQVFSLRSTSNISCIKNAVIVSNLEIDRGIIYKLFKQYKNIKNLNLYLKEFLPDIIYLRHMKYYPGIVGALKNISSYLVEINSNDIEESKKNNKLVHVYNKFTRGILLHNSSAFVSVSNELINDNIFKKYEKPSIVIANGYNFNNTQNHKKKLNITN